MKIPILLVVHDRSYLLPIVLQRILSYTNWNEFELWILDNAASPSTKKIINIFITNYKHIRVYSSTINQIALIQNEIISKLRSEIYIKLDDDIFVTENWTDAFTNLYNRHYPSLSFGSVIIPINGFGWIPFLSIMGYTDEFSSRFPKIELKQGCTDTAVWSNKEVCEFIWEKCLDMDCTAKYFKEKQKGQYQDLICSHRYSIGAIVFSHSIWEKMGGWEVTRKTKMMLSFNKTIKTGIKAIYGSKVKNRIYSITNILTGQHISDLGIEEEQIYRFSIASGLNIPVTTEGIVFHFSFGPTEQYLLNSLFLKLRV